ncbi:M50 family metallopeptidase [Bacillus sp. JJ1764]|uniref:M50 family metallopeptidase n=1 Tax=Bacillus sp. JJ1764 TaxID=3122964 RepID=UPI002FFD8183
MSTNKLILLYLGITLVGSLLPVVRVFLSHFHNLISLGISVCLEGGRKNKIQLHRDGTGQTTGAAISSLKKAITIYAGYTGTMVGAIGLFYLVERGSYEWVIALVLGFTILALLLWIRNLVGVIWALTVIVLLVVPLYFRFQIFLPVNFRYELALPFSISYDMILVQISILLASVLFIQSIITTFKVCRQSFMAKSNPGRKAAIVQTRYIPAVVLGLVLLGQNVFVGYLFVENFLGLPFHSLFGLNL